MIGRLRAWADRRHTQHGRYTPVGMTFHWLMAALVVFQFAWGWRTSRLPVGPDKLDAYLVHAQAGLAILVLALLRIAWRTVVPGPENDADKPGWQSGAAHLTHLAFYVCFLALPISGWLMLSATGPELPLSLAGLPWPHLPLDAFPRSQRWRIEEWAETAHGLLVWALGLLVLAHVGAALKHHFLDRDDVLAGMTPGVEPPTEEEDPAAGAAGSEAR